jgi:hypothetical protein
MATRCPSNTTKPGSSPTPHTSRRRYRRRITDNRVRSKGSNPSRSGASTLVRSQHSGGRPQPERPEAFEVLITEVNRVPGSGNVARPQLLDLSKAGTDLSLANDLTGQLATCWARSKPKISACSALTMLRDSRGANSTHFSEPWAHTTCYSPARSVGVWSREAKTEWVRF